MFLYLRKSRMLNIRQRQLLRKLNKLTIRINIMILSIKEDDLEVFLNLGLTQNQAKVYLALLKLGMESNASSLFQISGVSRQDVYRVLLELEKLGIVEK